VGPSCILFAFLVGCLLTGCGIPASPGEFNKTPEAQFLRGVVDKIAAREFGAVESLLDRGSAEQDTQARLERIAAALPKGPVLAVEPVAWHVFQAAPGKRAATIAAQYTYESSQWVLVSANLKGDSGNFRIVGFTIEPLPAPMAQLNAFTFKGKSIKHYVFFLITASVFVSYLAAFIQCLRTKGVRRKWLWALFTLFGVCNFTMNWSTGAVSADSWSVHLLGAGMSRAGQMGPWALTFSIPVGAIVFLVWNATRFETYPDSDESKP
jgi:hypothetical protein